MLPRAQGFRNGAASWRRTRVRFFTTQYFSHVFLFLEVMTVLPFPKLSYNSFPAKCRGGLCTQAQMGRCGPTLGSCWRVTDVKGLEQVGVGRRKGLIQQESRVEHSLGNQACCHRLQSHSHHVPGTSCIPAATPQLDSIVPLG